jgi:hypothetical protein
MVENQRDVPTLAHPADSMLALVIHRLAHGEASAIEVTSVLRRVCDESRSRPPEVLLLRIKELWTKVAGTPRAGRDDRDRRYYTLIGEALTLYFEPSPSRAATRARGYAIQSGCGEPEALSPS